MGHRSSMSSALTSGSLANLPTSDSAGSLHGRGISTSAAGINGFTMPKPPMVGSNSHGRTGTASARGAHQRTASASSWGRQSMNGVLNFSMPSSSSAGRLPTHSESSGAASRSPSTSESEPIVMMDIDTPIWKSATPRGSVSVPGMDQKGRRDSVSADKALREIQRAMASVEAQG